MPLAAGCLAREEVVELVERRMRVSAAFPGPVQALLDYALASRGKMLRAYLVVLTSFLWESAPLPQVLDVAAGVELIHLASLIHDDIVDDGEVRRGCTAVHRAFGPRAALLLGDYLFAAAFRLFAAADARVIAVMGRAVGEMSAGEIHQLIQPGRTLEEYWCYMYRKTASLLGACCEAGAVLAGQPSHWCERLRQFGEAVGIAFQLTDDVLDYRGSTGRLGKLVGKDYAAQVWTYPIIVAHRRGILGDDWPQLGFTTVQALLTEHGVLQEVWQLAQEWLARTRELLAAFPAGRSTSQLEAVLRELAVRDV